MKSLFLSVALICGFAASAGAEPIELENGDKFEGTIIEQRASSIVVDHPVLGRVEIPRTALKPVAPENPGLFGTDFLRGWKRNLGAGFSGASGNSQDASFNAGLNLNRSAETFRGAFDTSYFYSTKEGDASTNEYFANYKHDFLFKDSRFFLFGTGRYDYDQFQSWENRIAASAGAGYDFYKTETFDLRGTLGPGFSRTWGTENEWKPEAVLGLALAWRISESQSFEADSTYYPNLEDLPEFRLLSNAAYKIGLGEIAGLSLKLGVKDEYNSETAGDNNNLKYYGNIVYEF